MTEASDRVPEESAAPETERTPATRTRTRTRTPAAEAAKAASAGTERVTPAKRAPARKASTRKATTKPSDASAAGSPTPAPPKTSPRGPRPPRSTTARPKKTGEPQGVVPAALEPTTDAAPEPAVDVVEPQAPGVDVVVPDVENEISTAERVDIPTEQAGSSTEASVETSPIVDSQPREDETAPEPEPEPEIEIEIDPISEVEDGPRADAPAGHHDPSSVDDPVLTISSLTKAFGQKVAVDSIDLAVPTGSMYGIVGPNGAGKTTTLSMVTGLLRPDSGRVVVHDIDVWADPQRAKRSIGVLPDSLRLFDRLTGAQLLYYSGVLRGLDRETVAARTADLAAAFGIEDAMGRLVTDYSAGMTKKIALAAAMIHSPRLLILDEPFESVDPVSAANLVDILQRYVGAGGTVVLSSHGMDFIQRVCDHVAVIVGGRVLASGTMDEVREGRTLEDRFVELAGGRKAAEGMEWLHSFSD